MEEEILEMSDEEWEKIRDKNPPPKYGPKGFEKPTFNEGQARGMIAHMAGSMEKIAEELVLIRKALEAQNDG